MKVAVVMLMARLLSNRYNSYLDKISQKVNCEIVENSLLLWSFVVTYVTVYVDVNLSLLPLILWKNRSAK